MKKICIATLLIVILFMLSGCSNDIIYNTKDLVVTETRDSTGSLVQRSEFNLQNGITTSYLYTYSSNNDKGYKYCSDIRIVTIDSNGNIIDTSE